MQQGLVFRCYKTTTSEFLIGLRVVLNEHVCAELDHRRRPQRDKVSYGSRNLLLELNSSGSMQCQYEEDFRQLLKQKVDTPANNTMY